MDVFLSVAGAAINHGRLTPGASCRSGGGVTADGYFPSGDGGGDRNSSSRSQWKQDSGSLRHTGGENVDSLATVLGKIGVQLAGMALVSYISARIFQYALSDSKTQERARGLLKSKLPHRADIDMDKLCLNAHEIHVASDVVASSSLVTTFDMIGGLGEMKEEIMDIVTLACSREAQRQGVSTPRGILLSGVPGTGKTMLAQAIAKESGATFINVRMGAVQQKYVGEGEKIVAAIFSLAYKLAPSIIFMDEIDCFLRSRTGFEHDHVLRVKTEFMTLWDGLLTVRTSPVMVLGTTNRPADVDPAILRRLPRQFIVGLPARPDQRQHILELLAVKYRVARGVDLGRVASQTAGFSGSDLDALFQAAQTIPAREFARAIRAEQTRVARDERNHVAAAGAATAGGPIPRAGTRRARIENAILEIQRLRDALAGAVEGEAVPAAARRDDGTERARARMRPITQADFEFALEQVRPTGEMAAMFAAGGEVEERAQEQ